MEKGLNISQEKWKEKNASLSIRLVADSGYTCEWTGERISPEQWYEIHQIVFGDLGIKNTGK